MIELNFAHWEISLSFDGIIHSHRKKAETMTHIPFPITLMGSECASLKGTRSKGKAQMVTLPNHIDNSLSTCGCGPVLCMACMSPSVDSVFYIYKKPDISIMGAK